MNTEQSQPKSVESPAAKTEQKSSPEESSVEIAEKMMADSEKEVSQFASDSESGLKSAEEKAAADGLEIDRRDKEELQELIQKAENMQDDLTGELLASKKIKNESINESNVDTESIINVLKKINDSKDKIFLLESIDGMLMQGVLCGLRPSCLLESGDGVDLAKRISGDNLIVKENVLLNKKLVDDVIKNNQDYFQYENLSVDEVINIYFNNIKEMPIQVGLLLGFPKKSCEDFARFSGVKNLNSLREMIPSASPDLELCNSLINAIDSHMDATVGLDGEFTIIPPERAVQIKELLYKYLPEEEAKLSWDKYQGKRINIGALAWMEWSSQPEGEKIKEKYRAFEEKKTEDIEEKTEDICLGAINKNVLETLNNEDFKEIHGLILAIKKITHTYQFSRLAAKFNAFTGSPINSAVELKEYLKMALEDFVVKKNNPNV